MEFNRNVQVREEKFGSVIFETLKEKVFVTNPTGAEIVRLLKEKKSADEIATKLAGTYDGGRDEIRGDVNAFIAGLVQNGVIA